MTNILKKYEDALQALYDHVGFTEDYVVCPIDDCTDMYWFYDEESVTFHEDKETVLDEDGGNYYRDDIYTQRFYDKWVYVGEELTMIFCNPCVDGMKWFRVFDNSKKIK
jgi:hypothetical protein